jgi:enoyl-CoA hydratase
MEKTLLFEIKDKIAILTFNRPEVRNCFNQDLLIKLYNAIEEIDQNKDIKAAIITGNGKSFCTGIDLKALSNGENIVDPRGDGKDYFQVRMNCKTPLIGAVNGHAMTGGFEIALLCDFLIASTNASFADTHVKVGIHPGWGMSQLLQRAVGIRMAKYMSLTGEFINADQAYHFGLVNEIVQPDNLLDRAMEIASKVAANNQNMVNTVKNLIDEGASKTLSEGFDMERKGFFDYVKKAGMM